MKGITLLKKCFCVSWVCVYSQRIPINLGKNFFTLYLVKGKKMLKLLVFKYACGNTYILLHVYFILR